MSKIAINGLGRIGRAGLKIILETPDLELVAANDVVPIDNICGKNAPGGQGRVPEIYAGRNDQS